MPNNMCSLVLAREENQPDQPRKEEGGIKSLQLLEKFNR